MSITTEQLGEFVAGERPMASLQNTYLDSTGTPIDISGMQVRFTYWERWTRIPTTRSGSVLDGPAGKAVYAWDGTEFSYPGQWEAELWIGNGVYRLAADRFQWTVRVAVGNTVPSI